MSCVLRYKVSHKSEDYRKQVLDKTPKVLVKINFGKKSDPEGGDKKTCSLPSEKRVVNPFIKDLTPYSRKIYKLLSEEPNSKTH